MPLSPGEVELGMADKNFSRWGGSKGEARDPGCGTGEGARDWRKSRREW